MSCTKQTPCQQEDCGCPIPDLSANCVIYKGDDLACIGAPTPDTLESIIKKIDTFICEKLNDIILSGALVNIGAGAEIYKQVNNLAQREIRSIISSDDSVTVTQNEDTINLTVSIPSGGETYTFTSEDSSVTITNTDNTIDFSVDIPSVTNKTFTSSDSSITITETGDNFDFSVNFPTEQTQLQSDVLEQDNTSKAYIQNQNPTKVITNTDSPYTILPQDNNYVILADCSAGNIIINIPSTGLPIDNYFVGFLQKGNNAVSFTGFDIKPIGFNAIIQGEGHNAAVEIIETSVGVGTKFLLGALEETP